MEKHHLAYLATIRKDGAPRVHPVSPFIIDGRLVVATARSSPKAQDQLRDGRVMLNLLLGADETEFPIRARATAIDDPETRQLIVSLGPHYAHADGYFFEYRVEPAATVFWVNVGKPGTYPMRRRWPSEQRR